MTETINLEDRDRRSGIRDEWNAGRVREELVLRIQNGGITTQHETEKRINVASLSSFGPFFTWILPFKWVILCFLSWSETIQVDPDPSWSELIRPELAVRVDPVRLLYLLLRNCIPIGIHLNLIVEWKSSYVTNPFIRPDWPVFRKLWHIETTTFKKSMTNLRKWRKLTHVPRFLTSTVKPKTYGDKMQMFLRLRSVRCLLSDVIVADSIPWILLSWMLSWIRNLLATNGKGYDNSRLSDDIYRGSREIHGKWLRFTCPSCTSSHNGLVMKTSVEPL